MTKVIVALFALSSVALAQTMGGGGSTNATRLRGKLIQPDLTCTNSQVLTWNNTAAQFECATPPGASGGEANTASNLGTGNASTFISKIGVDLQFRRLRAATNELTIAENGNYIDFSLVPANIAGLVVSQFAAGAKQGNGTKVQLFAGSAPTTDHCAKFDANGNIVTHGAVCGEVNTVSNLGSAGRLMTTKSGVDFPLRSIQAASNKLTVTENGNYVDLDVATANLADLAVSQLAASAKQGNGTKVQLFAGSAPSTNDCVKYDANGNVITAGGPCVIPAAAAAFTNAVSVSGASGTFTVASATSSKPFKQGLSADIPATCAVGDTYFKTDAAAGSNLFGCTSPDNWTLLGGGAGDFRGPASSTAGHFVTYSDTTGKVGADTLALVTTVGTPGSDTNVPSEAAVRAAVSAAGGGNVNAGGTLTANKPVIGAGTTAVSVGTVTSTNGSTNFATSSGTPTASIPLVFDANGNIITTSAAITGPYGGTGSVNVTFTGPTVPRIYTLPTVAASLAAWNVAGSFSQNQTFGDGNLLVSGSGSGQLTIKAPATGGGTATFFAGSDTVVGLVTAQTLQGKTIDTGAAAPNVIKINGNTLSASAGTATVTVPNATGTLLSTAAAVTPAQGGTGANNTATNTYYLKGNGTNFVTSSGAASGTGPCTNQVVTGLNSDAAPTCTTITSAYVNNTIALTGTDINTSNQVTALHLASLPLSSVGITASNGGMLVSGAANAAIVNGTATANLPFVSNTSAPGQWAAVSYPTALTAGHFVIATGTNAMGDLGTAFTFSGSTITGSAAAILDMSAAPVLTGFKVPSAAGAAPVTSAIVAYDSTSHTLEYGANGTNRVVAALGAAQTWGAAQTAGTGGSFTFSGTGVVNANQLNGTALSSLGTGVLKNTTGTGVPSIAASSDIRALWTGTCDATSYLRGDGSCQTPSGSGNISNQGTITNTYLVTGYDATHIQTPSAAATLDASGNLVVNSISTGAGSGVAGIVQLTEGTLPTVDANAIGIMAPVDVTTAYRIRLPGTLAAGALVIDGSGDTSWVGTNGSGNILRSAGTAAIASSKTLTVSNTITLQTTGGGDSAIITFPNASATVLTTGNLVTATQGGTGANSPAAHGILLAQGASAMTVFGPFALDYVLMGGGVSADPVAAAVPNCGSSSQALAYSTSSHAWSCQTITTGSNPPWNTLQNAADNLSLTMGGYTTLLTYNNATGSGVNLFKLTDTASNTGTGALMLLTTAASSAATPWQADANGVGWKVDSTGNLTAVSTAKINKVTITPPATAATLTLVTGSTLQTTGAYTLNLTTTADSTPTFPAGTKTLMATDTVLAAAQMAKVDLMQGSLFCADAGANDTYACNLSPAATAYVTGTKYRFKANTANTGAASINFNSVGPMTIVKVAGGITTALADNDIRAGQWVECVYDGTNCQILGTLGNAGNGNVLTTQANTYDAGMKQSVVHSATTAGLNLGNTSGSPSSLANGDVWLSAGGNLKYYTGSATYTLANLEAPILYAPYVDLYIRSNSPTATIGTNGAPFAGVYIGGAATNNIYLAGTSAGPVTVTLPSVTSTLAILGANTFTGVQTFTPAARSSGIAPYLVVNIPSDTGLTASTEAIGVSHVTGTRTWATTGTVAAQRENVFAAPTYASASASQTFTKAATVAITGAPIAGTNAIISAPYALWVQGGVTQLDGALQLGTATNQLVTGTGSNLTTVNFPASSGAVTVTMPNVTSTVAVLGANTFTAAQTISATTNQLVTGTGGNLTTVNFPASSGAVTITMPNVASGVAYATSQPTAGFAKYAGSTYALTSATIAVADLPTVAKTRNFTLKIWGSGTASALQNTDDELAIWYNSLGQGVTITSVSCLTDSANATTIQLQKNDGSVTDMLSSNLSCSSTRASTTGFVSGENAMASTTGLDYLTVAAGASTTWVSVTVTYTLD